MWEIFFFFKLISIKQVDLYNHSHDALLIRFYKQNRTNQQSSDQPNNPAIR